MIKKNRKILILTSVVILLPMLVGMILWKDLPEQIPIHWNVSGETDGYSSKAFAVFGMPLLLMLIHWIAVLVTGTDPKRHNHSGKILQLVFWLIPLLSCFLSACSYLTAMEKDIRVESVMMVVLGGLFVGIGNYMPKCRQNYTIGIKLPWTLNSEENWNKTHRLAGRIWVIGGLGVTLTGFIGVQALSLGICLIMALVPMIYSYLLYKKGV